MGFKSVIENYIAKERGITEPFSIVPNKLRGQSITYTVFDSTCNARWVAKFFDYLKDIKACLEQGNLVSYKSLNELLDDIENIGDFPYNIEDIIDCIDLQKRCFDRYVRVGKLEGLHSFPKILHYDAEIKIGDSFYGLLIEDYVTGQTLEQRMEGRIENKSLFVYDFLCQLGMRLRELSKFGIIHRDLSPDNMIIAEGIYILIDPGVVKIDDGGLTKSQMMMGKKFYASPEQYFGNAKYATFKSDLYAVGIIALEIILGYNPLNEIMEKGGNIQSPHIELLNNYDRDIEDKMFEQIDENMFNSRLILIIRKLIQVDELHRFDSIDSFLAVLRTMEGLGEGK